MCKIVVFFDCIMKLADLSLSLLHFRSSSLEFEANLRNIMEWREGVLPPWGRCVLSSPTRCSWKFLSIYAKKHQT